CPIAPDARAVVMSAIDSARTNPVRTSAGGAATSGWVCTAVIAWLDSEERWSQFATAIDNLRKGNATQVLRLADGYAERDPQGHYSNLFDAFAAVTCADDKTVPTLDKIRTLQGQWRAPETPVRPAAGPGPRGVAWRPRRGAPPPPAAGRGAAAGAPRAAGASRAAAVRAARQAGGHARGRRRPDLAGRRPHRLPADQVRHQRRRPVPDRPPGAGTGAPLPGPVADDRRYACSFGGCSLGGCSFGGCSFGGCLLTNVPRAWIV